jgi:hypothetical protein
MIWRPRVDPRLIEPTICGGKPAIAVQRLQPTVIKDREDGNGQRSHEEFQKLLFRKLHNLFKRNSMNTSKDRLSKVCHFCLKKSRRLRDDGIRQPIFLIDGEPEELATHPRGTT